MSIKKMSKEELELMSHKDITYLLLEENGVIGPADGKKARDILMTEMEFRERFGG